MRNRAIRLVSDWHRREAIAQVETTPLGHIVSISAPTRSKMQNARLWAMLNDISKQQPMGRKHTPDDWKAVMMHACGWEISFVEGLDGRPFPLGFRSSKMTVGQMANLLDFIAAFGNENGIRWSEPVNY